MSLTPSVTLRALAETDPDRLAVLIRDREVTYAELDAAVESLAGWLVARRTATRATVVALRYRSTYALIVSSIAVSRAGLACSLVDPLAPTERAVEQLAGLTVDEVAPIVLTDSDDDLEQLPGSVHVDTARAEPGAPAVPASLECGDDDVHDIVYTSGSTGVPVGLVVDGGQGAAIQSWARTMDAFAERMRVGLVSAGTLGQAAGFPRLVVASGGTMTIHEVLLDGLDGIPSWLREQRVAAVALVPTLIRFLLPLFAEQLAGQTLAALRTVCVWGESSDWADLTELSRYLPADAVIHNAYATTETGLVATLSVPVPEIGGPGRRDGQVPAGRPLDGVTVRLLDPVTGAESASGEGEIAVASDHLARGHWRRPDLTAASVVEIGGRPFWRTGDGGRLDADGTLHVTGRLDDIVKVAAHRVALAEIEHAARRLAGVRAAAVAARADDLGAVRLHLYLVRDGTGDALSEQWARKALARRLPLAALPDTVTFCAELPTLANGKVDRARLPAPRPSAEHVPDDVATGPMSVGRLCELFAAVLGRGAVAPDDDFFAHGGDSLRATRLASLVRASAGRFMAASLLLEAPTPALLAQALADGEHPLVVPVRRHGAGVPLFVVHGAVGDVLFARPLAEHLDDRPVYGLQPPPLHGPVPIEPTLAGVAAKYVGAIRRVQPHGPYELFGFSLGGVVAFEMAVQLQAAGEQVGLLALGDSVAPDHIAPTWEKAIRREEAAAAAVPVARRITGQLAHRRRQVQRRITRAPRYQAMWERYRAGGEPHPDIQDAAFAELYGTLAVQHRFGRRFVGDVLLVRALLGEGPDDRGWSEHVDGRLAVVDCECDHVDLVQEPAVADLAAALRTTHPARP